MSEDLMVKALTGLMLEQKGMTDTQQALARSHREQAKLAELLARKVRNNGKSIDGLAEASRRQEQRFAELLTVMTDFSTTSTDTRKRLLALEQEVAKLKNSS